MNLNKISDIDWKLLKDKYPNNMEEIKEKINNNYPVQYLIGNVEFYNSIIEVNENVLIPRFETEYLVEKVIKYLKKYPDNTLNILDIGTGSGCIIISLAKELNQNFTGIDISSKALDIARKNAFSNKVNITFQQLDILNNELRQNYDVIISNPPYVDKNEVIDPSIKYEPENAIYASDNGLEFYKRILKIIPNNPKLIAFEIGMTQGDYLKKISQKKFPDAIITIEKDLTGKNRYLFIKL